jgi:hypothetical protein
MHRSAPCCTAKLLGHMASTASCGAAAMFHPLMVIGVVLPCIPDSFAAAILLLHSALPTRPCCVVLDQHTYRCSSPHFGMPRPLHYAPSAPSRKPKGGPSHAAVCTHACTSKSTWRGQDRTGEGLAWFCSQRGNQGLLKVPRAGHCMREPTTPRHTAQSCMYAEVAPSTVFG